MQKRKVVVRFGKYKELTFLDLYNTDPEYFIELRDSKFFSQYDKVEVKAYTTVYKKYVATKQQLSKSVRTAPFPDGMLTRAIELMYQWVNKGEFNDILTKEFNASSVQLKECYASAFASYRRQIELEKINLVSLHINRYEDLFKSVSNKDFSNYKPDRQWQAQIDQHLELVDILQSKEKIIGVHSKTFKIRLNNFYEKKKLVKLSDFNLDKLTVDEKIELIGLFDKCRVSKDVVFKVQENKKIDIAQEVAFEEVSLIENTLKDVNIQQVDNDADNRPKLTLGELKALLKQK